MKSTTAPGRARSHGLEGRRDQLVILVAIAALIVSALVVLAGLYITQYRPPRAHVLTVEGERFNAAAAQRRAVYLLLHETDLIPAEVSALTTVTLDQLVREAVLRARAPALVGPVSDEDLEQAMRALMTPPVVTTAGQGGATLTPTPLPDSQYATALQQRLVRAGISKQEQEAIVRADVLEQRLRNQLRADLPKAAPQVLVTVARLADQARAEQVRTLSMSPDVDFTRLATDNSVGGGPGRAGPLGWMLPEDLPEHMRGAVASLKAGEVSAVTRNGLYYEVYKLVDAQPDRELTEEQLTSMLDRRIEQWIEEERAHVQVERDLSEREDEWIRNRAIAEYNEAAGATRAG